MESKRYTVVFNCVRFCYYRNNNRLVNAANNNLVKPYRFIALVLDAEINDACFWLPGAYSAFCHSFRSIQFFLEL